MSAEVIRKGTQMVLVHTGALAWNPDATTGPHRYVCAQETDATRYYFMSEGENLLIFVLQTALESVPC